MEDLRGEEEEEEEEEEGGEEEEEEESEQLRDAYSVEEAVRRNAISLKNFQQHIFIYEKIRPRLPCLIIIPYSRKYCRGTNFGKLAIYQRIGNIKSAKCRFWVRFHERVVS